MKMPKRVYVRIEKENNGDEWLNAYDTIAAAVNDDGPTRVGVYELVETKTVRKVVHIGDGKAR